MTDKKRIIFAGIPDMALACLDALINNKSKVVGMIAPPKDHACFGIMLEKARQYNIPFIVYENLKDRDFLRQIEDLKPDIGVVASYDRLLPKKLLEIPKLGFLNVHPSLLPQYRGGNPYFHVIKNGERQSGVTIHYMDETFDTGDIVSQASIPIGDLDTMGTVFNKLNIQAAFMIVDVIKVVESGNVLPRVKQDKTKKYKQAKGIDPQRGDTVINWNMPCMEIDRFIRACNPFFGTISYFRGEIFRIYAASFEQKDIGLAKPGQIVEVTSDKLAIATIDGVIYPSVIYFGSYVISDAKNFIRIFSPKVGDIII